MRYIKNNKAIKVILVEPLPSKCGGIPKGGGSGRSVAPLWLTSLLTFLFSDKKVRPERQRCTVYSQRLFPAVTVDRRGRRSLHYVIQTIHQIEIWHSSSRHTAWQAMPSPLPVKPRCSSVVAFTFT